VDNARSHPVGLRAAAASNVLADRQRRRAVWILELAARMALVTAPWRTSDLSREAKEIYSRRDLVQSKFQHLCSTLETAGFATLGGGTVSYEKANASGRRPDLTIRRGATGFAIEVTTLALDREFRAIDEYCDGRIVIGLSEWQWTPDGAI
jgi:hypothetical protein